MIDNTRRRSGHSRRRKALLGLVLFGLLSLSTVSVVSAQQNQGGNNQSNNNNNNQGSLNFKATPELDSLALFGAGLLGVAGYAVSRRRARR